MFFFTTLDVKFRIDIIDVCAQVPHNVFVDVTNCSEHLIDVDSLHLTLVP